VKVGLIVPVFARDPRPAIAVATQADESGLDGVFSYDHLFPINSPDRPSLSALPMLAAMATQTERIALGTLVSRVTLLPLPVLVDALVTLDEIAGGRAIAGIGTGDRLTEPENQAYGMEFPPLAERLRLLQEAAQRLRERHIRTWIGGRSPAVRAIAARDADAWNSWDGPLDELSAFAAANQANQANQADQANQGTCEATWGGPPPPAEDLITHLQTLKDVGVSWVVYGPPASTDWTALVAKLAGAAKAVR
jgi:alkanesulfonate monooxygenase SsuD/methylene tetrahydromethanopterin reductase-like flavin-dependent oxidoreductase (luciferase family)